MMFRRLDDLPHTLTGEWRGLLPSLEPLRTSVRQAQRVYFARAASYACHHLAADRQALEKARPQIFPPFPHLWMEMAEVDDIGVLWQSVGQDMRRGSLIVVMWPRAHPTPTLYQFEADIGNPMRVPFLLTEKSQIALRAAQTQEGGPYVGSRVETGEWVARPVLAAFALLATKGMTMSVDADMSRLNRSRAKAGKPALLGYTEIRLNLDAERVVTESRHNPVGTGTMPQHWVRAHLRLLASGRVTIVRAHQRGNPAHGVKLSHYTVGRDEDFNS